MSDRVALFDAGPEDRVAFDVVEPRPARAAVRALKLAGPLKVWFRDGPTLLAFCRAFELRASVGEVWKFFLRKGAIDLPVLVHPTIEEVEKLVESLA